MKRLLLLVTIVLAIVLLFPTISRADSLIMGLTYGIDNRACPSTSYCRLIAKNVNTGAVKSVAIGTAHYCNTNYQYYHFQYGWKNCLSIPFWWNAQMYVVTSGAWFDIHAEQDAGVCTYSSFTRRVWVPQNSPVYAGGYTVELPCRPDSPVRQ